MVQAGYTRDGLCVKTGGGLDVSGHFTLSPALPVVGQTTTPAARRIGRAARVRGA